MTLSMVQHLVPVDRADLTQIARKVRFRSFSSVFKMLTRCLSILSYPKVEYDGIVDDLVQQTNTPSEQPEYDDVEPGK